MTRVLVVYGSRHGATHGIADRIGATLRTEGLEVDVAAADQVANVDQADAFVVGSGVYMGSWLKEPLEFVKRNEAVLAARPTWFFSSGPLPGSTSEKTGDPLADTLGPKDGPGSGGRKKVTELALATHARENRIFDGAFDPADPAKSMSERVIRMMPGSKGLLPPGDHRDWEAIDAWAREIAATVISGSVRA